MVTTLEALEKRFEEVEQDVAYFRRLVETPLRAETPTEYRARIQHKQAPQAVAEKNEPKEVKNMATTPKALEKRLERVEKEIIRLWEVLEKPSHLETSAERGARMLREAKANQAGISARLSQAFREMGITGEPIGAEELQKMIAAEGKINPKDNEFSRGIIEMREE